MTGSPETTHQFVLTEETDTDHVFACSVCGVVVGFNKPGIGEPNADLSGPVPVPPADVDAYVTPCTN